MSDQESLVAASEAIKLARRGEGVCFELDAVGDMQRELVLAGLELWHAKRRGHLYLAGNDESSLYKFGMTRVGPAKRVASLNAAGTLGSWHLIHAWEVYDAPGLEAIVLNRLRPYQVKGEIFSAPLEVLGTEVYSAIEADRARVAAGLRSLQVDLSWLAREGGVVHA